MNVLKRRAAIAAILALCTLPASGGSMAAVARPAAVSAAAPGGEAVDGVRTLFKYSSCAVGIARSRDGVGLAAAMLFCVSLLYDTLG